MLSRISGVLGCPHFPPCLEIPLQLSKKHHTQGSGLSHSWGQKWALHCNQHSNLRLSLVWAVIYKSVFGPCTL